MRRTYAGGRKKLVPRMDLEAMCPHAFTEEDGLQLEVDCEDCPGAQDLANRRCAAGILHIFSSEAAPSTVVLKRHLHKRYRGAHVSELAAASRTLSTLDRKIRSARAPSDDRCRTCSASEHRLARVLRSELLDDPQGFVADRDGVLARAVAGVSSATCAGAAECLARASLLIGGLEGRR